MAAFRPNPLFVFDHAVRDPQGRLEVRVAGHPLGRIQVDYQDPHGSTPDPNHMFP